MLITVPDELLWVIILLLVLYNVYVPYVAVLTSFYKTTLGKFVMYGLVVLAYQVSPLMAILGATATVRLLTYTGFEGFDMPPPTPPASSPSAPPTRPLSERPESGVPADGTTPPKSSMTSQLPAPRMSAEHENIGPAGI